MGNERTNWEPCIVDLRDDNVEAANVLMTCRSQVVTVGENIVRISIPAMKVVMDWYRVRDQKECGGIVMKAFNLMYVNKEGVGE